MESIRQRLALLPPAAIEVLELAACAGRQIDPVLLAAALGEKLSAVMGPLDRAGQAGMIVERGTGRIAFSHDLLREVLRRGIPRDKRLGLHQKLAAALASGNGSGLASAIAHQRLEAAELEPDEAVRAAITAANEALELVAYEEALELLDRAKQVVKGGAVAPALSAQLDVALGEARLRAGDLPGAKQACSDAVAAARALGDFELLANAALVWGSEIQQGVIDPDLVAWLTEANTALAANVGVLKARVLARLAAALQPSGRPLEPIQMARDAIALAREAGDDRALLEVLHSAMAAMMDYAHPAERMPLNLEQEALGQRFHDRPRELRARLRLFFDYLTLGDMGLAESRATSFDALARQLKQSRFEWFLPSWRAMRATYEGRWDDARAQIAAARGVAPPGQLSEVRDVMQQMALARARENRAEIAQCEALMLREWRLIEMGSVLSRIIFSANQVRLGDAAAGIRTLEELAASNIPISGGFITGFDGLMRADPVFLSMMADALALIDHPARKSGYALVQQVRGLQHQFGLVGMAWEGPFARPLALLARSLGHVDTAIDFFEEACADLERHSGRGHLARAWLETAEARLQRGAAGDVERAHALIAQARALATELQQSALLEVFSTRLGGAMTKAAPAARATPSQPPAGPAFSLRREGDTWEVKGEGAPFRLKDSRGLQLLARLAERPDQEVHCLELASDGPVKDIDASDAGDWLDPKAKREYRDRLEDLRESLREAEEFGDTARADLARLELEFIGAELSRGLGLGGRSRKAGSTAERARVAVQRRIKDAVGRIAEHDATLGRHLEWAVKTGTYCCYRPTR
jgi:tetratricopeptide (TPR) repeat protein